MRTTRSRHGPVMERADKQGSGLVMALGAYVIWGLLPLYLQLLKHIPAVEFLAWRIIFTLPVCLVLIRLRGQAGELRRVFADRSILMPLLLSSLLIGANWLIFMIAVAEGHVLATSLGYYINPLVSVVLGTTLLGERLSRLQWTAVAIAAAGILLLVGGALDTLAISVSLALTFAFYGFVRKRTAVGSVPGLTVETAVLAPAAVAIAAWYASLPAGSAFGQDLQPSLILAGSGVITASALMMFAVAARSLDLSTLGFVQFITPTITFVLSVTVLGETLDPLKAACFVLIWIAIGVFSFDLLRRRARLKAAS